MKKKSIIAVALLMGTAGIKYYYSNQGTDDKSLLLQNVEALTQDENMETKYIRTDGNCVYEYTGKAGARIGVSIAGVKVAELTIGADGKATYTFEGKTDCAAEGKQMCTPRYCPQLSFM